MDELVSEFLVETKDGLEILDKDLLALEQRPEDKEIIGNIFRAMHTIKGTCGFLGLGRLEKVAHAGENILDKIRGGDLVVAPEVISIILESVDQIKYLVEYLEENEEEPSGEDSSLITKLNACAEGDVSRETVPAVEEVKVPVIEEIRPPVSTPVAVTDIPAGDSEELQRLFDETEPLVDMGVVVSPTAAAPVTETSLPAGDSEELQRLFDETEPLVDMGVVVSPTAAAPVTETSLPAGDSEELQRLFDETEPLVDMEAEGLPQKKVPVNVPAVVEVAVSSEAKKDALAEGLKKAAVPTQKAAGSMQSIRVNLDVLERLMQQASELVLTRNQLLQILRRQGDTEFSSALHQLNHITTELQEGVMKTRMQPVGNAWAKLPRIIRDLANDLGKKIELKMEGEDTELDRQLLEAIKDPLMHMVRNSADHGLELPAKRKQMGKPETGTVHLKAYQGGGYIIIEISDDGGGIDPQVIKRKAIEKKLVSEADAQLMSDNQILQFIFAAGFSTAEKVTSVSGRGVGMDVVKSNIEGVSGTVELQSKLGKGSTFTIKIPLTLAIMPVLEVAVAGHVFAIPQINVMEVVKAGGKSGYHVEHINNKPVLRLRKRLLPLILLTEALQIQGNRTKESFFIVVCEIGGYHFGIIVDEVCDTEEIVVKPVAPVLKNIEVYSGCTILGSGDVIMILDPNGLAKTIGEMNTSQNMAGPANKKDKDEEQIASFVLFRAGDATPKVVPLELLSRLEEIDVKKIEYSHGDPVLQYRGGWMRICKIDDDYQIPKEGLQEFLVFANGDRVMGIAVEEVLDIVRCPIRKDLESDKDGFLGSLVIDGKTCDVIDSSYYFTRTFKEFREEAKTPARKVVAGKKLLLIDDSPFFRKFIPPELEDAGYIVQVASGGYEALQILEKQPDFAAIVTDMNMPGMSGQQLASACKADERFKDIPVIALSSHTGDEDIFNEVKAKGFSGYVSKTNHMDLIGILSNVLSDEEVAA